MYNLTDEKELSARRRFLEQFGGQLSEMEAQILLDFYASSSLQSISTRIERDKLISFAPKEYISVLFLVAATQLQLEIAQSENYLPNEHVQAGLKERLHALIDLQYVSLLRFPKKNIVDDPRFPTGHVLFDAAMKLEDPKGVARTVKSAIDSMTDHHERLKLLKHISMVFKDERNVVDSVLNVVSTLPQEDRLDICEELAKSGETWSISMIGHRDSILGDTYHNDDVVRFLALFANHFKPEHILEVPELGIIALNILDSSDSSTASLGKEGLQSFHLDHLSGWFDNPALADLENTIEARIRSFLSDFKGISIERLLEQ